MNAPISIHSSCIASMKDDRDMLAELTEQFLAQGNQVIELAPNLRSTEPTDEKHGASFNINPAKLTKMDVEAMEKYGEQVKALLKSKTTMKDILTITGIPYPAFIRLRDKLKEETGV